MLFGGRRSTVVPLVRQAFDWEHGVFTGAMMSSETTAAAAGDVGKLRFDPFAMLPFCGYHMGDYFAHWLRTGTKTDPEKLPKIFNVNWFRRDDDGKFLWPGYGENSRVLAWIFRRCEGTAGGEETAVGVVPRPEDLETDGLNVSPEHLQDVLRVEPDDWRKELPAIKEHFARFGEHLPEALRKRLDDLEQRLSS